MNRIVIVVAAAIGGSILAYTASFYAGVDRIAFALTMALAVAFAAGLGELFRFAVEIDRMSAELASVVSRGGDDALERCAPELRELLRSRLEGSGRPVPQPVFTPFLVGLLVMLGLLGTFLGLFETLRGAHAALAESQDVEALRAGLSSPMRGLMRSFGTSAAGVSTSAVLGLVAVFAKRRTLAFTAALSEASAGPLARFSSAKRQIDSLEALSAQGRALPEAASALSTAAGRLGGLEETIERALRGVAEAFSERAEKAMSDAVSNATALVRESAEATRTSTEAEHARLASWSQRFDESSRGLAEAVAAQAQALEKLEAGARDRLAESADRADAQLRALMEHLDARMSGAEASFAERTAALVEKIESKLAAEDEALAKRASALIDGIGARVGALVDRFDASEAGQRERVDALHQQLASLTEAQSELLAEATRAPSEAGARVGEALAQSAEGLLGRLREAEAAQRERAEAALDRIAGLGSQQAEKLDSLLARVSESDASQGARAEALMARLEGSDEAQRGRVESLIAQLAALDESQRARAETLIERLDGSDESQRARVESLIQRLDGSDESQRARVEALIAQLAVLDESQRARVESLIERLAESDESQRARVESLQKGLATLLEEQAHALGVDLQKQAKGFGEGIEVARDALVEAANTVTVAGAELSALAESFGVSVEHHREGAKAWLESLGELEAAIVHAGEGAAAEALTNHLAHTQELFDRQLRFQRELFAQLRALRGDGMTEREEEASDAAQ
jgi:hypothetical protein